MLYRRLLRPALFRMAGGDAEVTHERVLALLARVSRSPAATAALARATAIAIPSADAAPREVCGLHFPNPVGLAAGFDKNGVAVPALAALGFGFVEVGTVTARPQPGNPRPRLFRLPDDEALINRMGFNNAGAAAVASHLARSPRPRIPLGISLGKLKVTSLDEAVDDYLAALEPLYPYGDYFAVNISSPNTPGLRALHERDRLDALLAALSARLRERAAAAGQAKPKPLLLKVAPDLADAALEEVVAVALERGVSGLIAVNTTIAREGLALRAPLPLRSEAGGLSGRPLLARALEVVARLHALGGERLPIIGCGGIFTPDDARRMLDAGASLVQFYTGFIYEGPLIARRIARALALSADARRAR
jgi:dihydroorotate dehydrogenase